MKQCGALTLRSTTQRISGTDVLAMQGWQQMRGLQTAALSLAQLRQDTIFRLQTQASGSEFARMVRMHTVKQTVSLQPAKYLRILYRATWAVQQRRA
jgi:hypothetical protein